MSKLFLLLASLFLSNAVFAQKQSKFWVAFQDKNDSPYCTCRPAEFLSARALERRSKAGIPLEINDLPVNPAYLQAVLQTGAQLHAPSRWLNGVAILSDSMTLQAVEKLPFVQSITYLGPHLKYRNPPNRAPKKRAPLTSNPAIQGDKIPIWGYASQQNQQLGLSLLHLVGHRGAGIWVAVMDGGFTNADTIPMFDSIALQGRLFAGWDFVERDAGLFEGAQHGTSVLSVMAANLPQYFVGTAPDATYFLLKTEDTGGEFPIEEINWVAAAEWADSVGVDIINASLGYTHFNDPSLSHTYSDLDGRTAFGSRGAAVAASKGMIVCNSAGNEGDGTWRYIGVPADAPGIVAVGAVDRLGARADFSSFGPSADGRIKPDLVAPGADVVVAGNVNISLGLSSGTSLASPMLAGALASLWSAFPEKTAQEILQAVFATADQAQAPDNARGYGLPHISDAWMQLADMQQGNGGIFAYDALGEPALQYITANTIPSAVESILLRNVLGQTLAEYPVQMIQNEVISLKIKDLGDVPAGHYQLWLRHGGGVLAWGMGLGR